MEKAKDAMSERCQRRHGFKVERLPTSTCTSHDDLYSTPHGQRRHDAWEERLQDNTVTPIPEQAAFRIDFPAWLKTLTARDRKIVRMMARDERTLDVARAAGLSPARVSQLRRVFAEGWERYCGDVV